MNKTNKALKYFENFNCCQSVLVSFSEEIGLSESTCLKLGAGFGGGMNCGETCGAVTGAYMVLGLALSEPPIDVESKSGTKQRMLHFSDCFSQKEGSLLCKELLGVNISLSEGREFAEENKMFETRCPHFIQTAVEILEDQLAERRKGVQAPTPKHLSQL